MNPRRIIATVAAEYIGLRETSKNRGPHLDKFWKATSYKSGAENREPWCSAFVAFCVQETDRRSSDIVLTVPPTFPAVAQWLPWANKPGNGCKVFSGAKLDGYKPEAGDVVVFLPKLSHVGIVAEDYDGSGYVTTIEGNTNEAGRREGDGVWKKRRALSFCGSFIRIPAVAK